MSTREDSLQQFVSWWETYCRGDEKGEAQVFLDRLFQGFGHGGISEAGAIAELRIRRQKGTSFADLVWPSNVLIEMKKRGEDLSKHYRQLFEYWLRLVPNRPKYAVLCNFDEFWIYDLNRQLDVPVDKVRTEALPHAWGPLAFLFGENEKPTFGNDLVAVTKQAADDVAKIFISLTDRKVDRAVAQRYTLQCVLAMFAEDIRLLPAYTLTRLVEECLEDADKSYDLLGDLFMHMNSPGVVPAGRYKGVPYFNGGIFSEINRLVLTPEEAQLLREASRHDWAQVRPAIFGTIFEHSMDPAERHASGAHYTSEADIQKVVLPTIVTPWREKIEAAGSIKELDQLLYQLRTYRVLDPACGSGNFLYVAYRELKRLEKELLDRIEGRRRSSKHAGQLHIGFVTAQQFYGIDRNPFAVELAKVTLMIAKKLSVDELRIDEQPLPLDNLDANIRCGDALFTDWPQANVIIGNPPFMSKNNMQRELGRGYLSELRGAYPQMPGHADYCVYWFRRAHDHLPEGGRAGLVGTNTIRETNSRVGGLDYVVDNGGTIVEAISSQPWSGEANVSVSIVNWVKGTQPGKKKLLWASRDGDLHIEKLEVIPSSLSDRFDVSKAVALTANRRPKVCFQGQTQGHDGFLLPAPEADSLLRQNPQLKAVLHPFLTGDELVGVVKSQPARFVIDFEKFDLIQAQTFKPLFQRVRDLVMPDRKRKAEEEQTANEQTIAKNPKARVNWHHRNFFSNWWKLSYARRDLLAKLEGLECYIACSRVTKRPIFEFVDTYVHPADIVTVFALDDYYSFGVLQSSLHWQWFTARCSTLEERPRYTSTTVFDSFPWPQAPSREQVEEVAAAARALHDYRSKQAEAQSLRRIYSSLELPGKNPLRVLQDKLDAAVIRAYGFPQQTNHLDLLFTLNQELAECERKNQAVTGPGMPEYIDKGPFLPVTMVQYEI